MPRADESRHTAHAQWPSHVLKADQIELSIMHERRMGKIGMSLLDIWSWVWLWDTVKIKI